MKGSLLSVWKGLKCRYYQHQKSETQILSLYKISNADIICIKILKSKYYLYQKLEIQILPVLKQRYLYQKFEIQILSVSKVWNADIICIKNLKSRWYSFKNVYFLNCTIWISNFFYFLFRFYAYSARVIHVKMKATLYSLIINN